MQRSEGISGRVILRGIFYICLFLLSAMIGAGVVLLWVALMAIITAGVVAPL